MEIEIVQNSRKLSKPYVWTDYCKLWHFHKHSIFVIFVTALNYEICENKTCYKSAYGFYHSENHQIVEIRVKS
jgi:hypothetical protein